MDLKNVVSRAGRSCPEFGKIRETALNNVWANSMEVLEGAERDSAYLFRRQAACLFGIDPIGIFHGLHRDSSPLEDQNSLLFILKMKKLFIRL